MDYTLRRPRHQPRRYSSGYESVPRRTRLTDGFEKSNAVKRYRPIAIYKPESVDSCGNMSQDSLLTSQTASDKLRSTRSHSLKVSNMQAAILHHRSKRTFSLPCATRSMFTPLLQIEQSRPSDEDSIEEVKKYIPFEDTMAWYTPVAGLSCSLVLFFWSCLLSYYTRT